MPSAQINSQHFHQWDLRFQFECVQTATPPSQLNSKPHIYNAPVEYIMIQFMPPNLSKLQSEEKT